LAYFLECACRNWQERWQQEKSRLQRCVASCQLLSAACRCLLLLLLLLLLPAAARVALFRNYPIQLVE